jgi:hypothetical protein
MQRMSKNDGGILVEAGVSGRIDFMMQRFGPGRDGRFENNSASCEGKYKILFVSMKII